MHYTEIESIEHFIKQLSISSNFNSFAFQNINFSNLKKELEDVTFSDCIFLGCKIEPEFESKLLVNNYIFPILNVPYNCYPSKLYTSESLYNNYILGKPESYGQTFDFKVYDHYLKTGKEAFSIKETLARRLHDHAITDALYDFIDHYNEKKIVAVMGGHALMRNNSIYFEIALLAKKMCEQGYLMVTGGGPGAMEAVHLGTWFAGRNLDELKAAIAILEINPEYSSIGWLDSAFRVIDKFPRNKDYESLGIPTWLYGHEPATPFASRIAKYFANSVREDGLLTIAKGGVIFSPGSAGTIQEIFQDATQNHYQSFGYSSPMIFFGKNFWTNKFPVYPFLLSSLELGNYRNLLLTITDDPGKISQTLNEFSK